MGTREELETRLELSDQYYEKGRIRLAWRALTGVLRDKDIQQYPDIFLKTVLYCGSHLIERGKLEPAHNLLDKGRKEVYDCKEKVNVLTELMVCFGRMDRPKEAIKVFQEIEELYRRRPELIDEKYPGHLNMACVFYLELIRKGEIYQKEFREAYGRLEKQFSETRSFLNVKMLKALRVERNYDEAITLIHHLLDLPLEGEEDESHNSIYWQHLGRIYWYHKKDSKLALEYYSKSIDCDPKMLKERSVALCLAALNYSQRNYQQAIEYCLGIRDKYRKSKKELFSYLYCLRILAQSYKRIGKDKKYRGLMREIFRAKPFCLLSLPFIPDKIWLRNNTWKSLVFG